MSFKHTEKSDRRIRDGYARKERVRDIAAAIGVSRDVVIGRARRIGLATPTPHLIGTHPPRPGRLSEAQISHIRAVRGEVRLADLANRYGVHISTISRIGRSAADREVNTAHKNSVEV